MKRIKQFLLPAAFAALPFFTFAHGGVDDGHAEAPVVVSAGNERIYAMVAVGVFLALLIGFFIYAKRKNATPPPPQQ